jgi:hypothetical protein
MDAKDRFGKLTSEQEKALAVWWDDPVNKVRFRAAAKLQCPRCHAKPGVPCPGTLIIPHEERMPSRAAAQKAIAETTVVRRCSYCRRLNKFKDGTCEWCGAPALTD